MADPAGDLDNFFARKDKKKKGTQSGEKGKKRSNAKESNAAESSVLAETPNENDEWATIQDDISKSIMTIEGMECITCNQVWEIRIDSCPVLRLRH